MQQALFRALEFDRVREALAAGASTTLGRARALALDPSGDPAVVAGRLAATAEAVAFEAAGGSLALDAPEDLDETLTAIATADQVLAPLALLGAARFLDSVHAVTSGITRASGSAAVASHLQGLARRTASFAAETAMIRRAILPTGDIADAASPALKDIREALRRQRAKLRSTLEGLTRDSAKYLQDQFVTDRNGRYVVVVRAEHRSAVPGIVHGTSGSGASLYLEPLATVDLNNDIVALAEREKEEIHRILLGLTNALRRRQEELDALVEAAADLDELHARSRLASRLGGVQPQLMAGGGLEFPGARHPLLVLAMEPTPTDLVVMPPTNALVISGPNTGGKTVALKAFGLLAVMAQSGLFIPAEAESRFTPFRSIFANIGDDQSIAASLSTFSAHVAQLVAMDRAFEAPALVLLDEVGGGTDPAEGSALGAAIIDHFRQRGAIVVATTHDDALKSYAATTPGVQTAAFGFDPATFAPTYHLRYGAPGRSIALEIAARLGMPERVIADARSRRTGRESQLAAHLAQVDAQLNDLDRQRQDVARDRDALAAERGALLERESRLTEREDVLRKRLDAKLNEHLRSARAEVDAVVTRLKQKADALADTASRRATVSTGDVGGLIFEARAALGAIEQAHELETGPGADAALLDGPPEVGERVLVTTFGAEGIVRDSSGKTIEVEIRGMRMRVPLSALRRAAAGAAAGGQARKEQRATTHAPVAASEIVLIGVTVDDALDRLEKFLDTALLGDERRLRVVHGHGTGKLRDAVRAFFRQHPLVARVEPAPENEGGQGATIVELKE